MRYFWKGCLIAAVGCVCLTTPAAVRAELLKIEVENLTAAGGLFLTPVWFGFHDGSFDLYDQGVAASAGLEHLAEDGEIGPLSGMFQAAVPSGNEGIVFGPAGFGGAPVLDPGEVASVMIDVDSANRYFSYASMIIPSNDAFIANGDPLANAVFDANGAFLGPLTLSIMGDRVLDAGTEDNTEMDAAFLNQTAPDTGMTTAGGTVSLHAGFMGSIANPGGNPLILGGTNAAGLLVDAAAADFSAANFPLARITVTQVPEPASLTLLLASLAGLGRLRRKRSN